MYSFTCFLFTTLQDKYFALITIALQANTFQIRQQIAITCRVINHVAHVTGSFHAFQMTVITLNWQTQSAWSTSPFYQSCQRLSTTLFWLITPLLVGTVSHTNRWRIRTIKMLWMSMNKCRCHESAAKYIKTNTIRQRKEQENEENIWLPSGKPIQSSLSRKAEEVLPVSEDQSCCNRVTSECNFPWERLYHNDVSAFLYT